MNGTIEGVDDALLSSSILVAEMICSTVCYCDLSYDHLSRLRTVDNALVDPVTNEKNPDSTLCRNDVVNLVQ